MTHETSTAASTGQRREAGSALLVSLMVMVGLSLLGLGFVAISETESAISVNQRNYTQTLNVAESGAKAVVEWFQDPDWAELTSQLMPANNSTNRNAFLRDRSIDLDGDILTASALTNIGKYQQNPGRDRFCCDRPFKPAPNNRLFGTENSPDIWIRAVNADGTLNTTAMTFLNAFNAKLFPNSSGGRVTDIRIYAPPIINGEINASSFYNYNIGTRYGLATVRVTAEKHTDDTDPTTDLISQRVVTMVVSEWPFPAPQGPLQTNSSMSTNGAFEVHWGMATSTNDMYVKRKVIGFPWFNAQSRIKFEHGYDSANEWTANTAYQVGENVFPKDKVTYAAEYACCDYVVTVSGNSGPTEPTWSAAGAMGEEVVQGTVHYVRRWKTPFRNRQNPSGYFDDQSDWLYELVGFAYDDPWVEYRTRANITNSDVTSLANDPTTTVLHGQYHPFKYNSATMNEFATPTPGWSHWFQGQSITSGTERKQVNFPHIDYDFWKETAIAGQGQNGIYYLQWVADDTFRDMMGTVKTFRDWTNIAAGAERGFYFFDTRNGLNPQGPGGSAYLTPAFQISGGSDYQMSGFIYLNAEEYGTTGLNGPNGRYNFPGEPFRDIGYAVVDGSGNWIPSASSTTGYEMYGANNLIWDYKDLNDNGTFDLELKQRTIRRADGTTANVWLPVPYYPGCTISTDPTTVNGCSEPHEPYVNLLYPQNACCTGAGTPNPIPVGWEDPTSQQRRPKGYVTGTTTIPTVDGNDFCTDSAQYAYCTSNSFDWLGYYTQWNGPSAQDIEPILDGILYVEGNMSSNGNARYYGSVLVQGTIDNTGTCEVWFDEKLAKEEWPPKEWPFPRVLVTAEKTDE